MMQVNNSNRSTVRALLSAAIFLVFKLVCEASILPVFQDSVHIQGTPRITHYTKKEFNSDSQFWAMCQDNDGILYFANNDGALIFDGEQWQTVKLPNSSSIRSLKVSSDGQVYAGGFNELGTIRKDALGKYQYHSLVNLLRSEDRNIENIWQIHEVQGHIVFRSYKMLIAVANNKAVTLPSSSTLNYTTVISDRLYVADAEGLKSVNLNSLEFTPIARLSELNDEEVISLLPGFRENELLVITRRGSLYTFDADVRKLKFWKKIIPANSKNLVTCAIRASTGNYYLGTLSDKVISLDASGKQINNEAFHNLQDNTVLNLFESTEGNVWVLLNNGLDCIDIKAPVSLVFENASIYDALVRNNRIYLATNQGVFITPDVRNMASVTTSDFEKIQGLEGQAWSAQYFEGKALISHDRGVFVVSADNSFVKLPDAKGVWKVMPVKHKPGYYLVCTYDGIWLMQYDARSGFTIKHRLEGFNESSRDILESDESGIFWVCHGYKGVFRIKIEDEYKRVISVEHYKDQNGLPSPFNINVFRWNQEIVFTTNHGIYTYNAVANKFQPHVRLTKIFGVEQNVRKMLQHGNKTWFAHDNEVGYFITDDPEPKLQKGLFLQLKGSFNESMECITPVDQHHVLMGTNTGLYAFNLDYDATRRPAKTIINSVSYHHASNEIFCTLNTGPRAHQQLPYKTSGITFHFSAPGFQDRMNVQFSYLLENVDEDWSPWQEESSKEYSMLRPGKYVFRVKARSLLGESATESRYYLQILPLWYQTLWAYALYCVVGLMIVYGVIVLVKRKIQREREETQAEEKEKRKVLELEIHRIKLEREKEEIKKDKDLLEEDVIHKSKELANYTMLLVKKRELLSDIHEELKEIKEAVRNDASRQKLRDLLKKINFNLADEEHLQVFESNFERVHHEFFTELKTNFPDLTQKELRLCAFVRMNLTNKEIASILNISVRGVETARYRLRKRLSLNHEEDMAGFLDKLSTSSGENLQPDEEETSIDKNQP
jgi:AraC family transcriptional regulator, chitin signaling transcriptional activator